MCNNVVIMTVFGRKKEEEIMKLLCLTPNGSVNYQIAMASLRTYFEAQGYVVYEGRIGDFDPNGPDIAIEFITPETPDVLIMLYECKSVHDGRHERARLDQIISVARNLYGGIPVITVSVNEGYLSSLEG